jgi:ParB family chromosome partitioning protein
MLQPVLVRQIGERYQLISGERRLRAAIQAGWKTVPARVREADDRLVAELAIVENLQRKDLNPIEKALSFRRYLDEHQCPQEDLAKRLKIDRSTIANLLRLLELPAQVQKALGENHLSAGHARALLPLGDEDQQVAFADRIRREGLSVRATEQLVQETIREEDAEPLTVAGGKPATRTKNQQIASLEQELRMALGTKVDIRQSSRNRGRIVLHFNSHDEFERIRAVLTDTGSDAVQAEAG